MKPSEIYFSVNTYDSDGDVRDHGIFLHFGDTTVKAAENTEEFKSIVECMQKIIDEIEENYPDAFADIRNEDLK